MDRHHGQLEEAKHSKATKEEKSEMRMAAQLSKPCGIMAWMGESQTFRAVRDLQTLESIFCRAFNIMGVNTPPNARILLTTLLRWCWGPSGPGTPLCPQEAIPSLQGSLPPPNVPKQHVRVFSKAASGIVQLPLPPPRKCTSARCRGWGKSYPTSLRQPLIYKVSYYCASPNAPL